MNKRLFLFSFSLGHFIIFVGTDSVMLTQTVLCHTSWAVQLILLSVFAEYYSKNIKICCLHLFFLIMFCIKYV